ncbi:hypothetical protein CIHG_06864 [Coccidioides immitis H538.4]|uniref:Uncharacterized protein n=1 Tax=Coccidioides immitis H538.4 TaxID=396776 RepID=A0A0J8RW83_COCIT|nr:hypothetical protein CIHG_06864 [Coccidioides immitis H538.4]
MPENTWYEIGRHGDTHVYLTRCCGSDSLLPLRLQQQRRGDIQCWKSRGSVGKTVPPESCISEKAQRKTLTISQRSTKPFNKLVRQSSSREQGIPEPNLSAKIRTYSHNALECENNRFISSNPRVHCDPSCFSAIAQMADRKAKDIDSTIHLSNLLNMAVPRNRSQEAESASHERTLCLFSAWTPKWLAWRSVQNLAVTAKFSTALIKNK